MARPSTTSRVHEAVLALAVEVGTPALTMEGIAARAKVGKQTLYRTWPSPAAIVFDALVARSATGDSVVVPDTGDLAADLAELLNEAIAEMTTVPGEPLMRGLAAQIQVDEAMAEEFRARLLLPQLTGVRDRLTAGGVTDPDAAAELLLAPVFYRWFMRTGQMPASWVAQHVARVLSAEQ